MNRIRLGIIDRRAVLRASLCALFEKHTDFVVVWAATSPVEALQRHSVTPGDAILLNSEGGDSRIPDDLIHGLTSGPRSARLFLLLERSSEVTIVGDTSTAIAGCFLKTDSPATILDGIRAATSQRRAIRCALETGEAPIRKQKLTNRQIEIITHLADGASSKEIARRLHLSVKSVSSHSYRIMKRLNLHDRVALVRFAIREGLVAP